MPAYADYAFYAGNYLGAGLTVDVFSRLALRASEVIDQVTLGRTAVVVTAGIDLDTIEKVKLATCAAAEVIGTLEDAGGAVTSERIGNYAVTYQSQQSGEARIVNAIKRYLWDTGLMDRAIA